MPAFERYIGVNYSGAETAESSLKALQVYMGDRETAPAPVASAPSPRSYWSRREIADWLADRLEEDCPTLVGIEHGFSFPMEYFRKHRLPLDWELFLLDFRHHWPTDDQFTYVDSVINGSRGKAAARTGDPHWRRLTEMRAGKARSVFQFVVRGSVAKSTHAGLPWLLYLRSRLQGRAHFWPFDGWESPGGKSVVAEVYPSLWTPCFPREGRTRDQHDAYSTAEWMRQADADDSLTKFLHPAMDDDDRRRAALEGWFLGVM